jgi:RNA polymerase sigma-70 factor (ECF subfamily)
LDGAGDVGSDAEDTAGYDQPGVFSPAVIETLYRSYAARLTRRLARWVTRDEAGDAVQEAFAKIAGAPPSVQAPDSPEAYVTTVATNVLRDRARAAARQALLVHEPAVVLSAGGLDPHALTESREALRRIEQALSSMEGRRARIFSLHRFDHLTYAQIASEVGMSEKAVKKQIAKALVELRRAVGRVS